MEKRIWIHNPHTTPMRVGSDIVPPGETKDFPESRVPSHLRPAEKKEEEPVAKTDPLAELLKGSVKDVTAALTGLATADIERLGELEQLADQPRKTLLSAISEEILNRAADEQLAAIAAMSDEVLAAAIAEAGTDININPDYLMALEAESAKRKAGAAQ